MRFFRAYLLWLLLSILVFPSSLLATEDAALKQENYYAMAAMATGVVGLLMAALVSSPLVKMLEITRGMMAVYGVFGPFWATPTLFLAGASAAVGMAIVSSFNAFGQFISGFISGFIMKVGGGNSVLAYYGFCYVGHNISAYIAVEERTESRIGVTGNPCGTVAPAKRRNV